MPASRFSRTHSHQATVNDGRIQGQRYQPYAQYVDDEAYFASVDNDDDPNEEALIAFNDEEMEEEEEEDVDTNEIEMVSGRYSFAVPTVAQATNIWQTPAPSADDNESDSDSDSNSNSATGNSFSTDGDTLTDNDTLIGDDTDTLVGDDSDDDDDDENVVFNAMQTLYFWADQFGERVFLDDSEEDADEVIWEMARRVGWEFAHL